MKIISTVPSITYLLTDLGLTDNIIGKTKFCKSPANKLKEIEIIGGTKNINIDKIRTLNPDLIIANKEENTKTEIELLAKEFDVLLTDVSNLQENNEMILKIGQLTNTHKIAKEIVRKIDNNFSFLNNNIEAKKVLYLIWKEPLMSIGGDTFINEMLEYANYKNILENEKRYPVVEPKSINPDYVFLSSEPYPFNEKHFPEIKKHFPNSKLILVDGEMFSWFGSYVAKAPKYFNKLAEKINLLSQKPD